MNYLVTQKKLRLKLEEFGIQHNCQPAYGWTECGGIGVWDRSSKQNKEIFDNCCAKHFTTMTDGKLFRCPFSANVERLMAIPQANSDFVSVRHARNNPNKKELIKKKLRWFCGKSRFFQPVTLVTAELTVILRLLQGSKLKTQLNTLYLSAVSDGDHVF